MEKQKIKETDEKSETTKRVGMQLIFKTVLYAFAVFGLLFVLILGGVILVLGSGTKTIDVPEHAVLNINFDDKYSEVRQDDFFAEFMDQSVYSIFDLERVIFMAADDPRIVALSATVGETPLGLAQIQEMGKAVQYFRSKGKKAYIFSTGMGSFGRGTKEYVLASYFDQIWMQPQSDIGLTGVSIEVPFFRNVLDKVGVLPEFYTRHEYKNAMASFTDRKLTPQYKEELNYLGKMLLRDMEFSISGNRSLKKDVIAEAFEQAPLFAGQALDMGLIDKLAYRHDFYQMLTQDYNAQIFSAKDYMAQVGDETSDDYPQIALMVLEGVIQSGKSSNSPLEDPVIGSETVLKQLEEIGRQKNLKALVLRINSPGGSYTASDEILNAVLALKAEKKIPVVVSMSNYAASGGYFIALSGDEILADPATLTGSIGVLGGKFVLAELWKKTGVNWAELNFGQNAGILSMNHAFSPSEKAIFNRSLDLIYDDFTTKVSTYRHIPADKMGELARGRIWLGMEAVENGLADRLGGVVEAIFEAKKAAGIDVSEKVSLLYYPRRPSFQEKLEAYLQNGGGIPAVKVLEDLGISAEDVRLMQRLKFDAVLAPVKIKM